MRALARLATSVAFVALGVFAPSGCGTAQGVRPRAIAFEPHIVGCSGSPRECTSATGTQILELREAHNHLCPGARPDVLIKVDGTLACVASLPSGGPAAIDLPVPSATLARGEQAVGEFKAGESVAARSGCLACHRIGENGNNGPGSNLTHIGAELPAEVINRALSDSPAPMPSFSHLPQPERRALVYFLARLR